jgi:hypothetical protein
MDDECGKNGVLSMKLIFAGLSFLAMLLTWMPAHGAQHAIVPAYAYVSTFQSSIMEYKDLIEKQNRSAARKLLKSRKVFIAPKDMKVEVVTSDNNIAKIKLNQLNHNAEPVSLYFWTLAEQLKFLPSN